MSVETPVIDEGGGGEDRMKGRGSTAGHPRG